MSTNFTTAKSWVASAQTPGTDFPLQNLPYGRFKRPGLGDALRVGVAIGDQVLDLALAAPKLIAGAAHPAAWGYLSSGDFAGFMGLGYEAWQSVRESLQAALVEGSTWADALAPCLVPQAEVVMALPCDIGDYTDFYTGIHHATTVGKLFRPDAPLLPNYKWVPIGYHGRSSSIVVSGTPFHRPCGQFKGPDDAEPQFGPCRRLDYELELGAVIGQGNALGQPLDIDAADRAIIGLTLLNDWSARDVQAWEYQPLGPFLAKNFATTVSPWLVPMAALEPYRVPFTRPEGDPQPLPYLTSDRNRSHGGLDITLEVWLQTPLMRDQGLPPHRLSQSNFKDAYWTLAQLVTHHSSNGCNLRSGDLLGTGTQSGPQSDQGGSLLELSQGGRQALTLPSGETRTFLQDGDAVTLRAYCEREGLPRLGFGECVATVLPALTRA